MMIKSIIISLILLIFAYGYSFAAFSIETDLREINFGQMSPGEIKGDIPSQGVTVRCISDQGNAWYLRIRLDGQLTHIDSPSSVIPNSNFWWYGSSTTGTGTLTTAQQNFLSEEIVYQAPVGEGSTGVDINIKFILELPHIIQSGSYGSTIVLTLIE